jgi:NDP-4-keto-2,6-dideoxyhexose 3-C-methyltransferase
MSQNNYKCRICNKKQYSKIINLGNQPLSGVFPKIQSNKKVKQSPLNLIRCNSCDLIQLFDTANVGDMYGSSYGYNSGLSKLMINHLKDGFLKLTKYKKLAKKNNILDIGSNDSTFLGFYPNNNLKIGIDPSGPRFKKKYEKNKSELIANFFTYKNVNNNYPNLKFDIITSYAMFYDINNPIEFCKDIYKLLKNNGVWNLELSYLPLLIQNMTYDQICHEHVTYYDLTMLQKVLKKAKLKINEVSFNEINGGSFNIICSKQNSNLKTNTKKIDEILDNEKQYYEDKNLESFSLRIQNSATTLNDFLHNIIKSKKTIIGYGASTKGNIILNYSKIDKKIISIICDENPFKLDRKTPGTNIPIITKKEMRKAKPDYLFVLIWSFRKEVIEQELDYIKKGGKLIIPLPTLHIIDKYNYKLFLKRNLSDLAFRF